MLTLRRALTLSLFVAALSFVPVPVNAEKMPPGADFSLSKEQTIGGTGGSTFDMDSENVINNSPISQIRICSGKYIDSIQLFYGSLAGQRYGGGGGACKIWKVPEGEHITTVFAREGRFVDHLQFQTNKGTLSDEFGGGGGSPVNIQDGTSGFLRTIQVRHGSYVDAIKFQFGYPYYITDLVYDTDEIKKQLARVEPEVMDEVSVTNTSNEPTTMTANLGFQNAMTRTWEFGATFSVGISEEFDVGIAPMVEKTKVDITDTISTKTGHTETGTQSFSVTQSVKVNKNSKVDVILVAKKAKVTVPFTYKMVFYENRKSNEIGRKTYSGTFTSVQAHEVDVQVSGGQ